MPRMPLHDLGRIGLVTDIPGRELPQEALWVGDNIRLKDGYITNFRSSRAVGGTWNHAARKLFFVPFNGENYWMYATTTDVSVWKPSAGTHHELTRVSGDYTGAVTDQWNGCWINGVWIMNNGVDKPQFWADGSTATKLADLTNWPTTWRAKVIRPYKNFLLAMNILKSSTRYKSLISWSHPADPGSVPASWDTTDPTKLTGDFSLAQTAGEIVDSLILREANIIYKTDAIIMQQYVGGNDIFAWRDISTQTGLLGQNCAVEFQPGRHFLLTSDGDCVVFDGQSMVSVSSKRISSSIKGSMSYLVANKSFVICVPEKKEVWVCLASAQATTNYAYHAIRYVWNWETGTWGIAPQFSAWDTAVGNLDEDPTNPTASERLVSTVLSSDIATNTVAQHDVYGYSGAVSDTSSFYTHALSFGGTGLDGSPKVDYNAHKVVTEIWPNLTYTEGLLVDVTIHAADKPEDIYALPNYQTITWNPATESKIDCLIDGKFFQIDMLFYPDTGYDEFEYKLYGLSFEVNVAGEYP